GAFVGASTTIPMYLSVRSHIEQTNITNTTAHVAAIQNQLSQYHIIAEQLASRSEIKRRLEAYEANTISLSELRQFTQPRLLESSSQVPNLDVAIRYTNDGTTDFAIGPNVRQLRRFQITDPPYKTVVLDYEAKTTSIRIATLNYDHHQQQIGLDPLYFY